MTKKEVLNLMQFVCDQNNTAVYEVAKTDAFNLDDKQLRELLQVLEAKTRECFLRFIERM